MEARLSGISKAEVLSYLGCSEESKAPRLPEKISAAWTQLLKVAAPRLSWRIFDKADPLMAAFLESRDVNALLAESHHIVLFGTTLGIGVDTFTSRLQISDLAQALIFDACAVSAIENVCDNFCADIEKEYGHITERFSTGYGDLPLPHQQHIFTLLDLERKAGISLTQAGLMVPQKSVTAIFGIADKAQPRRTSRCENCKLSESCKLRMEGKACADR